jgi:hypothetical protein
MTDGAFSQQESAQLLEDLMMIFSAGLQQELAHVDLGSSLTIAAISSSQQGFAQFLFATSAIRPFLAANGSSG